MSQPTSQGGEPSMRDRMPETAKQVDLWCEQFGKAYVYATIRRAMAGEAGLFYALENGYVLGTPFPSTHASAAAVNQRIAVVVACTFAAFITGPNKKPVTPRRARPGLRVLPDTLGHG